MSESQRHLGQHRSIQVSQAHLPLFEILMGFPNLPSIGPGPGPGQGQVTAQAKGMTLVVGDQVVSLCVEDSR